MMMRTLADFLNHGILPFSGRTEDLGALLRFWRSTIDDSAMRVALIVGEAGSGKSRLLEELMPHVVTGRGVVVHLRLYPDSKISLTPLVGEAVGRAARSLGIPRLQPSEPGFDPLDALRRLGRLRPTLLAIDDVHLLADESLGELARLLDQLADETVGVVCLGRPLDTSVRGALERRLTYEHTLKTLDRGEIAELWSALFRSPPNAAVLDALMVSTLGNPLALRSALRGALKNGLLSCDPMTGEVRIAVSLDRLRDALDAGTRTLAEGMVAHLSMAELEAARGLALLGEVFARESAERMIDDAENMIERLTFKGILLRGGMPVATVSERSSAHPLLVFTHTLIHRHFIESATVDAGRLLAIIVEGEPLYSVLPFQMLAGGDALRGIDMELIPAALDRMEMMVVRWFQSSDWRLMRSVLAAMEVLADALEERVTPDRRAELRARLLELRSGLEQRNFFRPEFAGWVRELLDLTAEPTSEMMARYRLRALGYHYDIMSDRRDAAACSEIHRQAEELFHAFPSLRNTRWQMLYLTRVFRDARTFSMTLHEAAMRMLDEATASGAMEPEAADIVQKGIYPQFLTMFDSREEYDRRMELLRTLESEPGCPRDRYLTKKVLLLLHGGRFGDILEAYTDTVALIERRGDSRGTIFCQAAGLCSRLALGERSEVVDLEIERHLARQPAERLDSIRAIAGYYLVKLALVMRNDSWARALVERYLPGLDPLEAPSLALLALAANDSDLLASAVEKGRGTALEIPLRALAGEAIDAVELRDAALAVIRREPYDIFQLAPFHVAVEAMERSGAVDDDGRAVIREATFGWLTWLEKRGAWGVMEPLVERGRPFMSPADLREWAARIGAIGRAGSEPTVAGSVTRISMFGAIQVEMPGGAPQRLRGPSICRLLGVLVADRMGSEPMPFGDICRLVAGGEPNDPDRDRRYLNNTAWKLREAIGENAIITDRGIIRLNTDAVDVDLLRVHRLLNDVSEAIQRDALLHAIPAVTEVLDITSGDVPFPSLYDDLFEAAREELEFRVRSTVLAVARELMRHDDAAGAEGLLRRGFEQMSEDEEIAELLVDALRAQGKFIEAERVQRRAAMSL